MTDRATLPDTGWLGGRFRVLACLATVLPLPGLAIPMQAGAEPVVGPRPPYVEAARALERWIASEVEAKGLPALSIALVDDQRIVWARGFGFADPGRQIPADADTAYRVGSVAKLFTDLAMMQLVEQGAVDLDAPLDKVMPGFSPGNRFGRPITLRQLMAHRAGLVREPPVGSYFDPAPPPLLEVVRSLNQTRLVTAPGTHTKYSNAGVTVVGAVVERIHGEAFAAAMDRALIRPLGLSRTSFDPDPELAQSLAHGLLWTYDGQTIATPTFPLGIAPAGNLVSTVNDLGRFLTVLFAGGRGPAGAIVRPETLRSMYEPQLGAAGETVEFGLGFALSKFQGRRRIGHGGSIYGFATQLTALPDEKLGVVVIAAKDCANGIVRHISEAALRLMLAARRGGPLPPLETTRAVPPEVAHRLEGHYVLGERTVDIAARAGRLLLSMLAGNLWVELRLRGEGDTLIVDDCLAHGAVLIPKDDAISLDGLELKRAPAGASKPGPAAERFLGLIGEYGPEHDVLYILEKDGLLYALIEWFFAYPLKEEGPDHFRFPNGGLYEAEELVFTRDGSGRATQVEVGGVVFRRRRLDGESAAVYRITPVRPVDELRTAALAAHPPREERDFRAPDLVELPALDPTIKLEIRYASDNNFLGTPVYTSARAFMQRPAAEALRRAHQALDAFGYGLLIHDAYRPWYVTKLFWDATPDSGHGFVANPTQGSKHNRGAAVDLTLYDRATGQPLAMVGGYDEFSPRSYPDYPGGTSLQRWHRDLLRRTMEDQGFTVNAVEWWHFDYRDWPRYPILNLRFEELGLPERGRN